MRIKVLPMDIIPYATTQSSMEFKGLDQVIKTAAFLIDNQIVFKVDNLIIDIKGEVILTKSEDGRIFTLIQDFR